MAIDTRNRRFACIGFDLPWLPAFPNPDGSLANQADRQQMAYKYPGILAGAFVPQAGSGRILIMRAGGRRIILRRTTS